MLQPTRAIYSGWLGNSSSFMNTQAKMLVRRPVFATYSEHMQRSWYWRFTERSLERQIAAVA